MADFYDISALFLRGSNALNANVSSVLYEESITLLNDFRERSPVDSGWYKSKWQLKKSRFSASGTISAYSLFNNTPYAIYMEEGAEINKEPWYYPRSQGKKRRRTGKLAVRNGRVWAGGLNPGHSKTVRGAIGPVLIDNNRRLMKITNKVADAVIGGFK